VTTIDSMRTKDRLRPPATPPAEPPAEPPLRAVPGLLRWGTLVLLLTAGGIIALSIFTFRPIPSRDGLVGDGELVFYLSGRTADGALPLVDFQHGWNTGGWWVGAVLYRIADGSPNVFAFLFTHVTGRILAFSALATAVFRLRRPPALIAVVGLGGAMWVATGPPNGKYAIPALWVLLLLPTQGLRSWPRLDLLVHGAVAFVTLWLHVELAILLSAGVGFFELLGNQRDPLAARVRRVAALGAGVGAGVATELAFYAGHGVPVATVNDFVFAGQTNGFAQQYGWALSDPSSATAALFPLLVLAPFTPVLWRRAAPETRLATCLSLATAIVAIRRPDQPHVAAVSTLFMFTGVMLADDVRRHPTSVRWARGNAAAVLVGIAWAAALVIGAFETESLVAGAILLIGAALAVLASDRGERTWASCGALGALLSVALVGSVFVIRDRIRSTDPYAQIRTNAHALAPEVDRCLDGDRRAVIANTQISLYDFLGLENPTPYVQFHYDFARYESDLVADMRAGEVPAFIQTYPFRGWMYEVRDELERAYVPCSRVAVPATGNTITIWVGEDHAPAERRTLQAQPDGSLVPLG
jgi:hypothetical protein